MQKALFFMNHLRITQDENGSYSHVGSKAIDWGGKDTGADVVFAPFDLVVTRVRPRANGEVYVQSLEPVLCADGTVNFISMVFIHGDNKHLKKGQVFKQGEPFYREGGWGSNNPYKFGKHLHTEVAKGKINPRQSPNGLKSQSGLVYTIDNQVAHRSVFFVPGDTEILTPKHGFKVLPKVNPGTEKHNWRLVNPLYQKTEAEAKQIHDDIVKELGWNPEWLIIERVD